jgi:hypothetical protein
MAIRAGILLLVLPLTLGSGPAQQVTGQDLDTILERADKLFEEAKGAYETARSQSSVAAFVDAGFKLEEAKFKYLVLQEIGPADKQKTAADRLRAVNQLSKLIHDGKVAITGAGGNSPPPNPTDAPPADPSKDPSVPPALPPSSATVDVSKRTPVPDPAKQKEAEKLIKELFKEQYSKKLASDRKELARVLLNQASRSQDDLAALWVLYREAQDVAAQSGDVRTAIGAIEAAARVFDIDALSMKNAVITVVSKTAKAPEEFSGLAQALLALVEELVRADQYDAADKTVASALQFARKSNDADLIGGATIRAKEVSEAKTMFQGMKGVLQTLAKSPDDPGANLEIGKFLCFAKGTWDLGLRFMVKGSDATLRGVAEKELALSAQALERVALADGWYDLAQKEKSPLRKSQMLAHSKIIYESAISDATALLRAKIEKRLSDLTPLPDASKGIKFQSPEQLGWFVTSGGNWRVENGELVGKCSGDHQWATYKVAYSAISQVTVRGRIIPPGQHNFRMWVGPVYLMFSWEGGDLDSMRDTKGITDRKPSAFSPGKEHEIVLRQQGSKVVVTLDGKKAWDSDSTLNGTLSFQAAHDTTIGVRQFTIEGTPDTAKAVTPETRSVP